MITILYIFLLSGDERIALCVDRYSACSLSDRTSDKSDGCIFTTLCLFNSLGFLLGLFFFSFLGICLLFIGYFLLCLFFLSLLLLCFL